MLQRSSIHLHISKLIPIQSLIFSKMSQKQEEAPGIGNLIER